MKIRDFFFLRGVDGGRMKINLLRLIPAFLWMVTIFIFSHQEGGESGLLAKKILDWLQGIGIDMYALFGRNAVLVLRKSAHFGEYAILGVLLMLGSNGTRRYALSVLLIGCLYALSDEVHQYFIPGRVMSWSDVLIDSVGVFAGVGAVWLATEVLYKLFYRNSSRER